MPDAEANLRAAEAVAGILERHGVAAVVIGGVALAAHGYVRHTEDIDLGVNAGIPALRTLAGALRDAGFAVALSEPDADDPLDGVLDITGDFGAVQVISFAGRFPGVIEDALRAATEVIRPGSPLRLVPLPQLIALKLYAGGFKSKADIVELLARRPGTDVPALRAVCERYRLPGLDELLAEAGFGQPAPRDGGGDARG